LQVFARDILDQLPLTRILFPAGKKLILIAADKAANVIADIAVIATCDPLADPGFHIVG
jgi:hypothetical protein